MNEKSIIKDIMYNKHVTQAELAQLSGFNSQTNIANMLNRNTRMRVDNLLKLTDVLGCDVIIRDKEYGTEWIIGNE